MSKPLALIVAGPTCSGKSALAMLLAEYLGGTVINADAMQLYRELRMLTARPSPADEARVPHALYGVRRAAEVATAAWWCAAARAEMVRGGVPILCGGTGMYLNALLHGLSEIPEPGGAARQEARVLVAELGAPGLHAKLAECDPGTAARLRPHDSQRVARAWEVWRGTGRGLASWQEAVVAPDLPFDFRAVVVLPDRAALRGAIAERWETMIGQGAVDEVAALVAQDLDPALPVMRAHGVPEIGAYLRGDITLAEAGRRAVLATGQYTKRQATWLKHHNLVNEPNLFMINARFKPQAQFSVRNMPDMMDFLSRSG